VADYAAELLPALAQHVTVEALVPPSVAVEAPPEVPVRVFAGWDGLWERYDLAVYHIGNHRLHAPFYEALRVRPGLIVLHDTVLHHLFAAMTLDAGRPAAYLREVAYAHGAASLALARQVVAGTRDLPAYELPMLRRIVESALGIVVHSAYAARAVRATRPEVRLWQVAHHARVAPADEAARQRAKAALGLAAAEPLVVAPGLVTPAKRLPVLLGAFAQLRRAAPRAALAVVGEVPAWYNPAVPAGVPAEAVRLTGRVDLATFVAYLVAADVCVILRGPTAGETSGSALRALGLGRACIVSRVGWFAELPDECCAKVDHGPLEEALLAAYLERLAVDVPLRRALEQRAAAYAAREHALEQCAARYAAIIREVIGDASGT
jgi:glycosyltransferase involved in cell wall biosynthesis